MNFTLINKTFYLAIIFVLISSCSTKTIYKKFKIKKFEAPVVYNFDEADVNLNYSNTININFESKMILKDFKNSNQYFNNIIIKEKQIIALNNENKLLIFDYNTGEIISSKEIDFSFNEKEILVSLVYYENSLIAAFKSGSIFKMNINGDIIWKYDSNKILNTPLTIFNESIISLYVDEIKSLSFQNGSEIWSEIYKDLPVYQAKGGQLTNFLNFLYFILPNNKVGAIDYNIGIIHNSKFDELPLINSINNTNDKIHIYKNYLIYLDEGKYLYTFDIFNNDFILFKQNINLATSNILFNNSIILKEGNYLQAININNGKTFWLINDDKISKNSFIIAIRSYNSNIEIYLNNGDVLTINNKKLINTFNLNIGSIKNITFLKHNIIAQNKNGKIVIFK